MKCFMKINFTLFLSSILFCVNVFAQNSTETKPQYLYNPNYALELDKYKNYMMKQADIVMLGNSITHGINWNELIDRTSISEQGIPSDITEGVLNRLEYVYKLNPKICFIMIGVNDVFSWIPIETIFVNYKLLIENLKAKNIIPVIQSILYASNAAPNAENRNIEISKLNQLIFDYAKQNKIEFINLNKKMSASNFLKAELTIDGIHLNGEGFKIWSREVDKVLRKFSL
ncbi:MAG: GDSL family lipase [Ignavibacteriales bacterium CG18_big_fil_WC_8_21_14_2_50_31_20]|nr:MAG: GDSL family lipase [Ignavibacteriales bacterium CG18_big_fil_WC_8_21_14_2_50_31_20]